MHVCKCKIHITHTFTYLEEEREKWVSLLYKEEVRPSSLRISNMAKPFNEYNSYDNFSKIYSSEYKMIMKILMLEKKISNGFESPGTLIWRTWINNKHMSNDVCVSFVMSLLECGFCRWHVPDVPPQESIYQYSKEILSLFCQFEL